MSECDLTKLLTTNITLILFGAKQMNDYALLEHNNQIVRTHDSIIPEMKHAMSD